jgi:transcriptional regulator with PAS, ATPase and Fis domain
MASRSIAGQLVRFLHGLAAPVCVFDEDRRVVFVNEACARWAGVPLDELIGKTASYSAVAKTSDTAVVDRLCPPPEAFAGSRQTGWIYTTSDKEPRRRRAEFYPLSHDNSNSLSPVIVVADSADASANEESESGPIPLTDDAEILHDRLMQFRQDQAAHYGLERLVGDSPAVQLARTQARAAIASGANATIVGPPGVGRGYLARAIHYGAAEQGQKETAEPHDRPLLPLDGSLLTQEVLGSAVAGLSYYGRNVPVTLLLLQLDQVPIELQGELVRLLGARFNTLRFLATSQTPPDALLSEDRLHQHLAAAISTLVIRLPALADRRDDIPVLAQLALEELNASRGKQLRGFTGEALDALVAYSWPGNVAELREFVTDAFARAEGVAIAAADLPRRVFHAAEAARRPPRADEPIELESFLRDIERELIERALKRAKGNKARAARLLGLTRPRLYRRMVQLGLEDATSILPAAVVAKKGRRPAGKRPRKSEEPPERMFAPSELPDEFDATVPTNDEDAEFIEDIPFEEQPD